MHGFGPYQQDVGGFDAAGSDDECVGCFSLFQFSQNTDAASLEAVLSEAEAGRPRGGSGASDGSGSEAGSDDVLLEVNSWWLEHLMVCFHSLPSPVCQRVRVLQRAGQLCERFLQLCCSSRNHLNTTCSHLHIVLASHYWTHAFW